MNMWEAIVIIVVVTSVARMVRSHYYQPGARTGARTGDTIGSRRQRLAALEAAAFQQGALPSDEATNREAADLRRELAEVNARVKVLERIITEDRHAQSISAEIEALRDR